MLDILENDYKKNNVTKDHPFINYILYETQCMNCSFREHFIQQNTLFMIGLNDENYHRNKQENIHDHIRERL